MVAEDEDDVSIGPAVCGPAEPIVFDCGGEHLLEVLMFLQPHEPDSNRTGRSPTSSKRGTIPTSWLLLDSQSTVDVFSNSDLLSNIHEVDTVMTIRCNAGARTTNWKGYLSGYGWVWY